MAMIGRIKEPEVGRRYFVREGPNKGVYGKIKTIAGDVKTNPFVVVYVCDCWGGTTERETTVHISDLEI